MVNEIVILALLRIIFSCVVFRLNIKPRPVFFLLKMILLCLLLFEKTRAESERVLHKILFENYNPYM